jgi:hypothetical protein
MSRTKSARALALLFLTFSYPAFSTVTVNDITSSSFAVNFTITSLTVQLGIDKNTNLQPGDHVSAQFQDSSGNNIGAPVNLTVGTDGNVTISGGQFPVGSTGLGNRVVFYFKGDSTVPVIWYNSSWFAYGGVVSPNVKIDPLGLPGFTPLQSWFIDQSGVQLVDISNLLPDLSGDVLSSNFDLSYSDLGGGLFDAFITGNQSFLKLDNGTLIDFPDGTLFGNLKYLFNNGLSAGGTFDFTAIGFSGLFNWSSGSNYTLATANSYSVFQAPAVSTAAPEPGSVSLLGIGALMIAASAALRRVCRAVTPTGKVAGPHPSRHSSEALLQRPKCPGMPTSSWRRSPAAVP